MPCSGFLLFHYLFVCYVTALFLTAIVASSVCYVTILLFMVAFCFIICLPRHYTIYSRFAFVSLSVCYVTILFIQDLHLFHYLFATSLLCSRLRLLLGLNLN